MADLEDHPLTLELASLRQAVDKYQRAAHQSGIQLQGSRLECTLLLDRLTRLERTTTLLQTELSLLRANSPPPDPAPAEASLKALSLAHRKLSCLLDLTETELVEARRGEANAIAYRGRAEMELERLSGQGGNVEKTGGSSEVETEKRGLLEGVEMYDAQQEEGPSRKDSSELTQLRSELSAERALRLSAQSALSLRTRTDTSASSLIERYMAFSQSSSLALHASLETLKIRHAATLGTLEVQVREGEKELVRERARGSELMGRLGEAGEEVAREREGRRREVLLRLASMAREERLLETLRRWQHRAQLTLHQQDSIFPTPSLSPLPSPSLNLFPSSPGLSPSTPSLFSPSSPRQQQHLLNTISSLLLTASTILDSSPVSLDEDWLSEEGKKVLLAEELAGRLVREFELERVLIQKGKLEEKALPSVPGPEPSLSSELEESEEIEPEPTPRLSSTPSDTPTTASFPLSSSVSPLPLSTPFPPQPLTPPLPPSSPPSAPPTPSSALISPASRLPDPPIHPLIPLLKSLPAQHQTLQRSFLTLHNSLQSLIQSLSPSPSLASSSSISLPSGSSTSASAVHPHFLTALTRLFDICEDARVELEISLDDRRRIAEGFVLGLSLLGIGPSSGEMGKLEGEVREFVGEGEDGGVGFKDGRRRKRDIGVVFGKRLEDLEFDLALIKSALDHPSADIDNAHLASSSSSQPITRPQLSTSPSSYPAFPSSSLSPSSSFYNLSSFSHRPLAPTSIPSTPSPLASLSLRNPMPASLSISPSSSSSSHNPYHSSQSSTFPQITRSHSLTPSSSFGRLSYNDGNSSKTSGGGAPAVGGMKRPSFSSLGRLFGESQLGGRRGSEVGAGAAKGSPTPAVSLAHRESDSADVRLGGREIMEENVAGARQSVHEEEEDEEEDLD